MTLQGKREALDAAIEKYAKECADIQGEPYKAKLGLLSVIGAYGDERELAGHVGACCQDNKGVMCGNASVLIEGSSIWYCEAAPRRPA